MSVKKLSSRAIIGEYYAALDQHEGANWVNDVSMLFTSDQPSEEYAWLGQSPTLREWIGGREAKGLSTNGLTIKNLKFESTLELDVDDMRRDKTGQVLIRIGEMADRTNAHWALLLSQQIMNGESQVCYDGQFFFDVDHAEGDSGTQSNKLTVTLSALVTSGNTHGSTTAPSAEEMSLAIIQGITQILSIKDDTGVGMNTNARKFTVMVPTNLMGPAMAAVNNITLGNGITNTLNTLKGSGFDITVEVNPLLTWTNKFSIFRRDGRVKSFIRQEEVGVQMKAVAEGSELEFNDDKHHYGIKCNRNVGFGYWQYSLMVVLAY
jgi:phage major head subunit gpT-like protein